VKLEFENYERNAFQELTEQHHSSLFGQNFVKIKKQAKQRYSGCISHKPKFRILCRPHSLEQNRYSIINGKEKNWHECLTSSNRWLPWTKWLRSSFLLLWSCRRSQTLGTHERWGRKKVPLLFDLRSRRVKE
jgi:hypothetical protein